VTDGERIPVPGAPGAADDPRGVGWAWPVRAVGSAGPVELAYYEKSIADSILVILGTAKGERVMRPTFGCGLHEYVFEPLDSGTAALVSFEVREALLEWEPRIKLLDVRVDVEPDAPGGARLLASIDYAVRRTNTVFNLVYPFYLRRGRT
jgi:hypothetical protein